LEFDSSIGLSFFIVHLLCLVFLNPNINSYMNGVIRGVGFLLFSLAVLYVVSKRIGILTLQRKVTGAIKAGMVGQAVQRPQAVADDLNLHQVRVDHVHNIEAPLQQQIHDEL
jgi:protein transport protein SEC20